MTLVLRAGEFGDRTIGYGFPTRDEREPENVVTLKQVHGSCVRETADSGAGIEGDAVIAREAGVAVGVRTADCLPVLLYAREERVVAAVHCGWRGIVGRIQERAVERLGVANRAEIQAAVGPGIGACCFVVHRDAYEPIAAAFPRVPDALFDLGNGAWRIDLRRLVHASLASAGVNRVFDVPICTVCRPDLFHSFRRDRDAAGRHVNFIERLR
ncbi:MAG: polyphenol oxidase family protein [Deltaproteobacteria bacterium]|nr:polyphenol oxidase family protein [Deltaproteobacteria bacterium]